MKAVAPRFRMTDLCLVLAVIFYALPAQAGQSIIVFDPPGSTGTFPSAINAAGEIAGSYTDQNHNANGFLRTAGGAIVPFAFPAPAQFGSALINSTGVITGNYFDANFVSHGFVRTLDGIVTSLDPPDSTSSSVVGIDPAGVITGNYNDANSVSHGFVRTANGTVTALDPLGSTGTSVVGIDPAGVIAGSYNDANSVSHGFVRAANGAVTSFDPPGSIFTGVSGIGTDGTIVGFYVDGSFNTLVFLRTASGAFTTFGLPLGLAFPLGFAINTRGEMVGNYFDSTVFGLDNFLRSPGGTITTITSPDGFVSPGELTASGAISGDVCTFVGFNEVCHGFLQTSSGSKITYDPPGSTFTSPTAINSAAEVTGNFIDANFAAHGFVFANH